ncbi:MAG: M42 family peptidase, partial [Oscillospiraceae bacterium]|nr:M42 family peptidase [Oscillospiraceae bacterium]
MTELFKTLQELCELSGVSGDENAVAEYITGSINPEMAVIRRDNLGNVLVFKKGKQDAPKRVMFTAHMDEVGFIINSIT